jgi:hypothetical protein
MELVIQNNPQRAVAAETAAHSNVSIPALEAKAAAQFRFRILVVDDDHAKPHGRCWKLGVMRFSQQWTD